MTLLIDNTDATTEDAQCTTTAQLLAYSLGLFANSSKYEDSIFYHESIEGTLPSKLDYEIIELLYGNHGINAGDTREDILSKVTVKQ